MSQTLEKHDVLALQLLQELLEKARREGLTADNEKDLDYLWDRARMLHRKAGQLKDRAAGNGELLEDVLQASLQILTPQAE